MVLLKTINNDPKAILLLLIIIVVVLILKTCLNVVRQPGLHLHMHMVRGTSKFEADRICILMQSGTKYATKQTLSVVNSCMASILGIEGLLISLLECT